MQILNSETENSEKDEENLAIVGEIKAMRAGLVIMREM